MAARHMRPQHSALVRWKDETQLRRPLDLEIPLIPRRRLYAKAMSLPSRDRIYMLTGARRSANPAAPPSRTRCFTLASSQWAIDCSSLSSSRLSACRATGSLPANLRVAFSSQASHGQTVLVRLFACCLPTPQSELSD